MTRANIQKKRPPGRFRIRASRTSIGKFEVYDGKHGGMDGSGEAVFGPSDYRTCREQYAAYNAAEEERVQRKGKEALVKR